MSELKVAWFDTDSMYVSQLQAYCRKNFRRQIEILSYSEADVGQASGNWDILVAAEAFYQKLKEEKKEIPHILISEGQVPQKFADEVWLYKYQAADQILRQILAQQQKEDREILTGRRKVDCYGVLSETGKGEQVLFTTFLTRALGEEKRVLYLNFMQLITEINESAEESLDENKEERNISELLYMLLKGAETKDVVDALQQVTVKKNGFDCVRAAQNPEHIVELNGGLYEKLLTQIASMGVYDAIVMDLGPVMEDFYLLLRHCNVLIYLKEKGIEAGGEEALRDYIRAFAGLEGDGEALEEERLYVYQVEKEWFTEGEGVYQEEILYSDKLRRIFQDILRRGE